MELRKFIATTIREYLNEQQNIENNLNDNFWKWFGKSKLITNGKPNIYYHGTTNKFKIFDKSKINMGGFHGKGFYFYNNDVAGDYYGDVMECYLRVRKPYDMNEVIDLKNIKMLLGDYIYYKNEEKILDMNEYGVYKSEIYHLISNERLQELNYDGIIHRDVVVVFEPNQIKSVKNDGSWDINDDNIYS